MYTSARAYPLVSLSSVTCIAEAPSMTISLVNGVNPLQTTLLELGIVSSRVALLLRSAEIQPVFGRFVTEWFIHSPPPTVQPLLQGGQRASSSAKVYFCNLKEVATGRAAVTCSVQMLSLPSAKTYFCCYKAGSFWQQALPSAVKNTNCYRAG